ncbi:MULTISPECIES: DUF1634 domain-containing protein [Sphingobacterium]|uniref:DUF1634 domain-containing protein n=1 Tax=Sphingobacterium TaxID=28453 RepID=UPI0013DC4FBF|nr:MULTISPECIES: DUF1634 domain-containing protein [unclassified Sphingobacterium]
MKQVFSKYYWNDKDISILVGQILRIGVTFASATLIVGGILYLMIHGQEPIPNYKEFVGESTSNTTITEIIVGAFQFRIPQIIQFGVLLLICTPILRVIGSLFGFVIEKDIMYVVITLIVLGVIIASIFSGVKG